MIPIRDNLRCKVFPYVTLTIIALNLLAWFYELMVQANGTMHQFMMTYCMIPAKVIYAFQSAEPYLILWAIISIFTCMFLHGSWMHIIGNMLYFYAFAHGMEARLGRLRFVAFYVLCGLAATSLQIWSNPNSISPNLGASGAIAGVLGGYILFWPKSQVKGFFLLGPIPIPVKFPAFIFLLAWFVIQLASVLGPQVAASGVAYWAHVGGFLGGVVLAGLWKLYKPQCDVCYIPINCDCPADENRHDRNSESNDDNSSDDQ